MFFNPKTTVRTRPRHLKSPMQGLFKNSFIKLFKARGMKSNRSEFQRAEEEPWEKEQIFIFSNVKSGQYGLANPILH